MPLFSLSNLSIQFGAEPLLAGVSLGVDRGERWGVVGRNGSGKTSIFRAIIGDLSPESGVVVRSPGLRVSLLDQHRDFAAARTVWEAACTAFAPLLKLEKALEEQAHRIGELGAEVPPALLAQYDRDLECFGREGGYEVQARVSAVLHGLGFDPESAHHRPLESLSGGERGRLGLASQLVAPADLLLLDEPTNHLDLETTEWLTQHLKGLDSAVLLISHDRAFLDAVADHILHLEAGTAVAYTGGYSAFVAQRAERRLAEQRAYQKQARVIAAEEDFIRRNIAGQKSSQAKGRRRRLERLPRLSPPPGEPGAMALRFRAEGRGGDQVLVAEQLRIAVEDRVLLSGFSATIRRGDVLGIVGPNGAGKTTLLGTLLGDRPPDGGSVRLGESTRLALYRQDLNQVPREKTLFEIIHDLRPTWTRGQVMDHLGRFDFPGEETGRRAGTLSGGELARVALAMMTLAPANVLVFDEPTNHLDVETIEALEDAIEEYEGTVVLVSHDRALLRGVCGRIWSLEDAHLTDYDGSFADWEASRLARRRSAEADVARREAERRAREKKREGRAGGPERSAGRAERRALTAAEGRIKALEEREAELHSALADPALYDGGGAAARAAELGRQLEQVRAEFSIAFRDWEVAAEAVERLSDSSRPGP